MFTLKAEHAGWPVEARVNLGREPEHFLAAERIASTCKRGDEVTVVGEGLTARSDHSVLAVLMRNVKSVEARGDYGCFVVPGLLRKNEGKLL